jgi:poly(A) polymerase
MLRAVRFARQLGCTIEPATLSLCAEKHGLISRVSIERIKKELFTLLHLSEPALSLRQLLQTGIAGVLLPEFAGWAQVVQGPPHQHNLLEHSLQTVERLSEIIDGAALMRPAQAAQYLSQELEEGVTRRALLVFASLLHDSGKPGAAQEADGKRHFHGHAQAGGRINRAIAKRLGLGRRCRRMVETLTAHHMRLLQLCLLDRPTERAKFRLLRDCDEVRLEVMLLAVADILATGSDAGPHAKVQALAAELLEKALEPSYRQKSAPLITGRDIMKLLGIDEGPQVGRLLQELHRAEQEGRINTLEDAEAWLKAQKDRR